MSGKKGGDDKPPKAPVTETKVPISQSAPNVTSTASTVTVTVTSSGLVHFPV